SECDPATHGVEACPRGSAESQRDSFRISGRTLRCTDGRSCKSRRLSLRLYLLQLARSHAAVADDPEKSSLGNGFGERIRRIFKLGHEMSCRSCLRTTGRL